MFIQPASQAQTEPSPDTTPVLRYEIDTSVEPQALPAPITDEDSAMEVTEESQMPPEPEYFLRKEFTGGFQDSLQFRRLPDSTLQRFLADDEFWYANEVFKKRKPKQNTDFTASPFFQTLLWFIIIGGFASFLMIYLYNSNAGLFRKSRELEAEREDLETGDIFAIHYPKEIDRAVQQGDYRLAVRLLYLQLLRELADREIIRYKPDHTNFDYLLQLQSTGLYRDFFRLTRNYEYSWYGQFDLDREKFGKIKNDFEQFDRKFK
jgi:hypothetical protein